MLSIDRRDIINDDLSMFDDTARSLGRSGDAVAVRSGLQGAAGQRRHASSAAATATTTRARRPHLASASLATGIARMMAQRDDEERDLDIRPRTLLVPPELAADGQGTAAERFHPAGQRRRADRQRAEERGVAGGRTAVCPTATRFTGTSRQGLVSVRQPAGRRDHRGLPAGQAVADRRVLRLRRRSEHAGRDLAGVFRLRVPLWRTIGPPTRPRARSDSPAPTYRTTDPPTYRTTDPSPPGDAAASISAGRQALLSATGRIRGLGGWVMDSTITERIGKFDVRVATCPNSPESQARYERRPDVLTSWLLAQWMAQRKEEQHANACTAD